MSELTDIINSLEVKFAKLIQKQNVLEAENKQLKNNLAVAKQEIQQNEAQLDEVYKKYESLQLANSLLGSEDNRRYTKLKINTLIKEIDQCIAHLTK
jgi:chromosome segregation ATPase